jgi:hypothetical protein
LESVTSRELHLGKLHRERAVTGRIFQALPRQTDTVALIYKMFALNFGTIYLFDILVLIKVMRSNERRKVIMHDKRSFMYKMFQLGSQNTSINILISNQISNEDNV